MSPLLNWKSACRFFYDELIEVLSRQAEQRLEIVPSLPAAVPAGGGTAARHGKESLRLGYTISQVVHGYGAICQAITGHAHAKKFEINSFEFQELNRSLDVAIAEAVTEFSTLQLESVSRDEITRLGFLAHELRNALAAAMMAHELIRNGVVGSSSNTGRTLLRAHERMRDLIDRTLSEVRLQSEAVVSRKDLRVIDLVSEVEATAAPAAKAKSVNLHVGVDPQIVIHADPHLVISALFNLVQNAIKFTPASGTVLLRGSLKGNNVHLEVEDECGGFATDAKLEELFAPFTQNSADHTGLGLGLTISRRAAELNGGTVTARNLPGKGCVFSLELPEGPSNTAVS